MGKAVAGVRAWLSKTFTYRLSGCDLLFLLLLTAVFFSVPVLVAPDSGTYLHNARVLAGEEPFSAWSSVRGPVFPALLRLSIGLFGETAYGTAVMFYLLYLVLVASTLYLCHLLGIYAMLGKALTWLVCTVFIFLNPTVLTYAHFVLAEYMALAMVVPVCCVVIKTHLLLKRELLRRWPVLLLRYGAVVLAVVLLYALKQMFFVLAAVPFVFSEAFLLLGARWNWRRLVASVLAVLLLCAAIPAWSTGWDAIVSSGGAAVRQDLTAQSIAYSSLIDGLRYFRPAERYTTGKPVRIDVMADDYRHVEKSFTYTFDGSFAGSLHFLGTCFAQSPQRFWASWVHNYWVIGNIRKLVDYEKTRAYTPINLTTMFWYSAETLAWMERFKTLGLPFEGGEQSTSLADTQFHQPLDDGLVVNLIFNTGYPVFSFFVYSFAVFCAPWVLLLSIGMCIWRRKTEKAVFWRRMALLSGSVFFYIAALAVTAANIDRYGFPATVWCALMLAYPTLAFLRWAWQRGKRLYIGRKSLYNKAH